MLKCNPYVKIIMPHGVLFRGGKEEKINIYDVNQKLHTIQNKIQNAQKKHNTFLKELNLPTIPDAE